MSVTPMQEKKADPATAVPQITQNVSRSTSSTSISAKTEEDVYPGGWRIALVMIAIYLMAFLIALVRAPFPPPGLPSMSRR